jgi:polar amino acid transport system substrate-binding protein
MQPWARVYNTTLHTKNTLLLSISRIKQREPLFEWIGLATKRNYFLFGLSNFKVDPNMPLEDIEKYRVAIIRQTAIHQYLVSKGLHNQQLISSYRQAIKMLLSKRVDLVSGIGGMFIENCYRLKLDCDQIKPVYQFKEPSSSIFIAMNKSTDIKVITRIKAAYQKVLVDNK